ncbi:TPA: hypothetical protein QHU19_003154 [Klebsiella aerogenes]|jgi:DHA1 family multidrug resistance protein-like MFS transporter|nr:hypothetical protein [Klebsiella aerogenes]EIV2482433.1 hypothetical protein [Klebsiella aerogenes]EJC6252551.1 hypothetical protein [Klebsiella aerogenes]EJL5446919.1 hypothetical protein [Klebsiella aerogenes]EKW5212286.1 hypothetical protein [Klebsiella aerogenes]EKY1835442.1 hypothetical protein [Klebsiella aerogenes]
MVLAGRRSLIVELSASLFNPALFPVFALQFFFMYFYSHIEYLLPIFITHQYSEYFVSVVFFVNTLFVIFAQTVFSRIFNELRAGIAWGAMALFHWWRLAGYLRPTPSTASYSSTLILQLSGW